MTSGKLDEELTLRLVEGEPLPTSYGKDLYERIFGTVTQSAGAVPVIPG